jgi:hypothetical protein
MIPQVIVLILTAFPLAMIYAQPDSSFADEPDVTSLETLETGLVEHLQWLADHPLDLNTASYAALCGIPYLDPSLAASIIRYRHNGRRFSDVSDLVGVPGMNPALVGLLRPLFTVRPHKEEDFGGELRMRLTATGADADEGGGFRGPPHKSYSRLSLHALQRWEAGFLAEKDAGERARDGFLSGFISLKDCGPVSRAVVGDYIVQSGRGLVLGSSALSGSVRTMQGAPRSTAIIPYRSSDEFHFMRGAAVEGGLPHGPGRTTASFFWSRRRLPASTASDGSITSIHDSGLFRTAHEISLRSSLEEKLFGTTIHYTQGYGLHIGASYYNAVYDRPVRLTDWSGRGFQSLSAGAVIFRYAFDGAELFLEKAFQERGGGALFTSFHVGRSEEVLLLASYRDYHPGHVGFHAAGPGSRDDTRNERGLQMGITVRVSPTVRVNGGVDLFFSPAPTSTVPQPATGHEVWIEALTRWTPNRVLSILLSQRPTEEDGFAADSDDRDRAIMTSRRQWRVRGTAQYALTESFRFKTRIEITRVIRNGGRNAMGFLAYQDFRLTPVNNLSLETRVVFFQTDSYDARVYEFENGVPGVMFNPALAGTGRRWYVVLRLGSGGGMGLSGKYSETERLPQGNGSEREWKGELQVDFRL